MLTKMALPFTPSFTWIQWSAQLIWLEFMARNLFQRSSQRRRLLTPFLPFMWTSLLTIIATRLHSNATSVHHFVHQRKFNLNLYWLKNLHWKISLNYNNLNIGFGCAWTAYQFQLQSHALCPGFELTFVNLQTLIEMNMVTCIMHGQTHFANTDIGSF